MRAATAYVPIANLAEVNPPPPAHGLPPDATVSFIPMSDVSEAGQWVTHQRRRLREIGPGYTPFAESDVLFAKITPCMENGKGAHAVGLENGIGFGSNEFHVLRARPPNEARFIYHWLQTPLARQRAIAYMGGSAGQQRVQSEFFAHFAVPPIAPDDQRRIAAVLDTVDVAIAQTEAVIAKLKSVRAGLLHDLLTRGLDANGSLRPPPDQAPHLYKDSPVGRIPREWEVRCLVDCLDGTPQNGIYKPANAIGRGTLLIGQTSITLERSLDPSLARRAEVTKQEREQYALRVGDILISRVFATLDGVGQPALVPDLPEYAVYESNMMRLHPNADGLTPLLLFHWLRTPQTRSRLTSGVNLSNQASVNQQTLNTLPVVVPLPAEQRQMENAIGRHDGSAHSLARELHKLRSLKSGLMSDLLTGRVRVESGSMKEES